jgi:hypothetical protein
MRDLEREIGLYLRRRVLGVHPFVKPNNIFPRGREQVRGTQAQGSLGEKRSLYLIMRQLLGAAG